MQMQSMQMQQNIMTSLKGATGVMGKINEDMNVNEIRDVMKDFNKEMMKQEIIGEQVADGFSMLEDPNANADAEDLYNGILGEVGLEYTVGQAAVPSNAIPQKEEVKAEAVEEDDGLEARLAALKMS